MNGMEAQRKKYYFPIILGGVGIFFMVVGAGLGWSFHKRVHPPVFQTVVPIMAPSPVQGVDSSQQGTPASNLKQGPLKDPSSSVPNTSQGSFCIELFSLNKQPVSQAEVLVYRIDSFERMDNPSFEAKGELGVVHGVLPFPEEVIAGVPLPKSPSVGVRPAFQTTTDAHGIAMIPVVIDGFVKIVARKEGLSSKAVVHLFPDAESGSTCEKMGARIALVLEPFPAPQPACGFFPMVQMGAESIAIDRKILSLQVVDPAEHVVSGAFVNIESGSERHRCVTDASGRCQVMGAFNEHLTVSAFHSMFAPTSSSYTKEQVEKSKTLILPLKEGMKIVGIVQDERTGMAPPSIRVEFGEGRSMFQAQVDPTGRFSFSVSNTDALRIRASAPGYAFSEKVISLKEKEILDEVRMYLQRSGILHGYLRVFGGSPSMKVIVKNASGEIVARTMSNAHGQFTCKELPPGELTVEVGREKQQVQVYSNQEQNVTIDVHSVD